MENVYVGIVDREIPSTLEVEKCRLLNKLQPELGYHYMISFKEEPLEKHPYVIISLLDQFRREDNEYSFRGFLVGRDELIEKLKEKFCALVLRCTVMKTVPSSITVLASGEVD